MPGNAFADDSAALVPIVELGWVGGALGVAVNALAFVVIIHFASSFLPQLGQYLGICKPRITIPKQCEQKIGVFQSNKVNIIQDITKQIFIGNSILSP